METQHKGTHTHAYTHTHIPCECARRSTWMGEQSVNVTLLYLRFNGGEERERWRGGGGAKVGGGSRFLSGGT
jgi:hypothetical protein